MSKKRKKKRKLRVDRIIMVLVVFTLIIFLAKFIPYVIYNQNIYNSLPNVKNNTVVIKKKYSKLKLYNKTIDYMKEHNLNLKIKYKNAYVILQSKNISKNMTLKIDKSNKKLAYKNYSNDKSFVIENNNIIKKSDKFNVFLPSYLQKNNYVDIYGVTKNDEIEVIKLKNKANKIITINQNKKYKRYFVTYIAVSKMNIQDLKAETGDVIKLNVTYEPENATLKEYEYTKIGDIFMKDKKGNVIAKKEGISKITIKHKTQKLIKSIIIKVDANKKEGKNSSNELEIKNIDGLTYVNGILIVNKTYSLPKDYDPGSLSDSAKSAFDEMQNTAKNDNIKLWIASGYRSYLFQTNLYNNYVLKDGKTKADTYSARPGHSEHQTGLAMDLNIIDSSFEGTPEAIWIEKNCYKYGFIIRYPKGKEEITGYKYEPWHIRYLGKKLAEEVYNSGKTLEEYLNITSKYSE